VRIGVLTEQSANENRVCLTPPGAAALTRAGHEVLVESGAGGPARFHDDEYRAAGARVVYAWEEVVGRADLVMKVSPLVSSDVQMLHEGQTVLAFHHLAAAPRALLDDLQQSGATLIGYEVIENSRGDLPVLHAMSEIAGQLSVHIGAHYLETQAGGRGILLGAAAGIPPARVLILGAGVVGLCSARTAAGSGADVLLLDTREDATRRAARELGPAVRTGRADTESVARAVAHADLLIGAVLNRGERAPLAVTRTMVESMKPGSVIVDVSIDQGGCVATSRPTTLDSPTFVDKGVTHYCVPNMASAVGHSASVALTAALLPFVEILGSRGVDKALEVDPGLAAGVYLYRGQLVSEAVARAFGLEREPPPWRAQPGRAAGRSAPKENEWLA